MGRRLLVALTVVLTVAPVFAEEAPRESLEDLAGKLQSESLDTRIAAAKALAEASPEVQHGGGEASSHHP